MRTYPSYSNFILICVGGYMRAHWPILSMPILGGLHKLSQLTVSSEEY